MSTTSLKLPDDLKARTATAAKIRGLTPHAFMVEAIQEAATATERRALFVAAAKKAHHTTLESGRGYDADDVHAYLRDKISGRAGRKPKAKSWRG